MSSSHHHPNVESTIDNEKRAAHFAVGERDFSKQPRSLFEFFSRRYQVLTDLRTSLSWSFIVKFRSALWCFITCFATQLLRKLNFCQILYSYTEQKNEYGNYQDTRECRWKFDRIWWAKRKRRGEWGRQDRPWFFLRECSSDSTHEFKLLICNMGVK